MSSTVIMTFPIEIQDIILSFAPRKERLQILREKYPQEFLREQLYKLPRTYHSFRRLYYRCMMLESLIEDIIDFSNPEDPRVTNLEYYHFCNGYFWGYSSASWYVSHHNVNPLDGMDKVIEVALYLMEYYTEMYCQYENMVQEKKHNPEITQKVLDDKQKQIYENEEELVVFYNFIRES